MNQAIRIPRVAAVHDLCGYGNCSLGIAMPVLSAAGIEVCPLPTAILAAHTAFPVYTFYDTTPQLPEYLDCWDEIRIPLDGVYSGFLGSAQQIDLLSLWLDQHHELPLVLDPVMGDHGKIYKTYTEEMCAKMKQLARRACVLTPNMTEAAILLDIEFPGQKLSPEEAEALIDALLSLGSDSVILKGIVRPGGIIVNAVKGKAQEYRESVHPLRPYALHGTGDLFASFVAAGFFRGKSLPASVRMAGKLTASAIDLSIQQKGYQDRGVSFEPILGEMIAELEKLPPA